MPAARFGRLHHLPPAQIEAVVDDLRRRGLVDAERWFTDRGREVKARVEQITDDVAAAPYEVLAGAEQDELVRLLEPLAALLIAAQD